MTEQSGSYEFQENKIQHEAHAEYVGVFPAWPYANGPRHLGHGASLIAADIIARYERAVGSEVIMVSGTDEHGTPNQIAAEEAGLETLEYVTEMNKIIRDDFLALGMSFDRFSRTTSPEHADVVHEIFQKLYDKGYITEGEMLVSFDKETSKSLPDRYVEGGCPNCSSSARGDQCDNCGSMLDPQDLINPVSKLTGNPVEFKMTEHMFLRLDLLSEDVQTWLENNDDLRSNAKNMSLRMADDLRERAITRDLEWGIPLPPKVEFEQYNNKVLYVWFEAVIGYLSTSIAHAKTNPNLQWENWWQNPDAKHFYAMGKDNIPFHTLIWPSILIGSGKGEEMEYNLPNTIASTEYLTFNSEKLSSSKGNVVYIRDLIELVGPDALRYYLISAGPETNDKDFNFEEFVTRNNTELIANWGNLVNRTLNLTNKNLDGKIEPLDYEECAPEDLTVLDEIKEAFTTVGNNLRSSQFRKALHTVMEASGKVNKYLYDQEPWKKFKAGDTKRAREIMSVAQAAIYNLAILYSPFMPHSSNKIHEMMQQNTNLLGNTYVSSVEDRGFEFEILTGDYSETINTWRFTSPTAAEGILKPQPLFKKLELEALIEDFDNILRTRSIGKTALSDLN